MDAQKEPDRIRRVPIAKHLAVPVVLRPVRGQSGGLGAGTLIDDTIAAFVSIGALQASGATCNRSYALAPDDLATG
jgi:hypothetical protein